MKTLFVLIITAIVAQFSLQAQDRQWYVWEGHPLGILNQVLIDGISPVPIDRAYSRHDIFVIFEDNNFYSSRFAFPGRTGLTRNILDDFTHNQLLIDASDGAGRSSIRSLYWTNLYDDDDDPTMVSASLASSGYAGSEFKIKEYTRTKTMVANHDIVRGTDITVVVPIWKYIETDTNTVFKLKYNYVVDPAGDSEEEIIMSSYDSHWDNYILIDPRDYSGPYEFFNFHVNNDLSISDGVVFGRFILEKQIIDGSYDPIDTLDERILTSHDPNHVWVKSYCRSGNDTYINYRIQYFNDGKIREDRVKIGFYLPDYFVPKSLCEIGSNWGEGYDTEIKYQQLTSDENYIVFYNKKAKLSPMIFEDKHADGYIDFCVKMKKGTSFPHEPRLLNPTIHFGDNAYEIIKFIQDEKIKEEKPCTCKCKKEEEVERKPGIFKGILRIFRKS